MIIIALVRSFILERLKLDSNVEQKLSAGLLFANVVFGIVVLLLSGIATALAQSALASP